MYATENLQSVVFLQAHVCSGDPVVQCRDFARCGKSKRPIQGLAFNKQHNWQDNGPGCGYLELQNWSRIMVLEICRLLMQGEVRGLVYRHMWGARVRLLVLLYLVITWWDVASTFV